MFSQVLTLTFLGMLENLIAGLLREINLSELFWIAAQKVPYNEYIFTLMSTIECKYCLPGTSYLAGLQYRSNVRWQSRLETQSSILSRIENRVSRRSKNFLRKRFISQIRNNRINQYQPSCSFLYSCNILTSESLVWSWSQLNHNHN